MEADHRSKFKLTLKEFSVQNRVSLRVKYMPIIPAFRKLRKTDCPGVQGKPGLLSEF